MRFEQVGALCVRRGDDGELRVLLVTSRETCRWIIPKGWVGKRLAAGKAAAREAFEEAGVIGRLHEDPVGRFAYIKRRRDGERKLLKVSVYLMFVQEELQDWPEKDQRQRAWLGLDVAAQRVLEPDLRSLICKLPKLVHQV